MTRKFDETMPEDEAVFGSRAWVYCNQHLAPHTTGWCTVGARDKTLLDATNYQDAQAECRAKGFKLYVDLDLGR